MATQQEKTRWQLLMDSAMRSVRANPLAAAPFVANDARKSIANWFNTVPGGGAPAAPVAAPPPVLAFGPQASAISAATGAAAAPQTQAPDIGRYIQELIPGTTITSGPRTEADNKRVGGVANSYHLISRGGLARDFTPPEGMDMKTFHAQVQAGLPPGWKAIDEKDHVHVQPAPSAVGTAMPTISRAQAAQGMPVGFVDPSFAMGMVPNPRMLPMVDLPSPPQREMPAEIAPYAAPDKTQLLSMIEQVIRPKAPDTKNDKWDRVAAMLQQAAAAASTADPNAGLGQMILRAGAGAGAGFAGERKAQTARDEEYMERLRQAELALGKLGLDIDLQALAVGNQNLDRQWKSGENVKDTRFQNAQSTFEANLQEIMTNLGITQQNVGALNTTDQTRARVGLGAVEGAVGAQNAANASVAPTGRNAVQPAELQEQEINTMLIGAGLDASNTKAPNVLTARGTAAAILANDVNGALQNLATELVMNGAAQAILAPQKGEAAEVAKLKQQALQALKQDPTGKKGGAQQAMLLITQLLNSNHATALQVAKDFQATSPSARIILQQNKAQVK